MEKQLTDEERTLWSRYFLCDSLLAIAKEYNAKRWPVNRSTEGDTARYIGAFCYVYDVMRTRQKADDH